jgi:uncharacterized membrane protein
MMPAKQAAESNKETGPWQFFTLFIIGFSIIFIGIIILIIASLLSGGGTTNSGILIFIGPIPIIIGTGPDAQWLIILAVVLTVISAGIFLATRRKTRKTGA